MFSHQQSQTANELALPLITSLPRSAQQTRELSRINHGQEEEARKYKAP